MRRKRLSLNAPDSFACAVAQEMPKRCKISVRVTFSEGTRGCGVMLRASEDLESAYYIRLEPGRNRLVFDSWPRKFRDCAYWAGTERPIALVSGKPHELRVFVDDIVCEVYADGEVAMSTRLYDLRAGRWGVFVSEGTASFDGLAIAEQSNDT